MLLPPPKRVTHLPGAFVVPETLALRLQGVFGERERGCLDRFAEQVFGIVRISTGEQNAGGAGIDVRLCDGRSRSQAYTLRIDTHGIALEGEGPAGLFYGLQTLQQIIATEDRRWACRIIRDAPDLPLRGLSLDVSRGRIPTQETLFGLVDRLAALKMNHLQLYVEHTFDFTFDPDIGAGCSPLTADDVCALDDYCRERFVELVPSLATFGHMGRILSLPRYRELAEIPAEIPWESQPWPQRLRGLTIDCRSGAARRLLTSMLDEYLPLFSSGLVNINADETHDLGRGRNREIADRIGRGRLYIEHLRFLHEQCRRHGKRMMFWGDVIRNHPELLGELPEDAVLLDWGYEADSDFPAARSLRASDREVCVCPGTSGWNRLINAYDLAEANIANAVAAARGCGAGGMIVTDWGDHGHFNMLACSLPPIAYAAAHAWNADGSGHGDLDRSIEMHLFGPNCRGLLGVLRDVSRPGNTFHTWCALYQPWRATDPSSVLPRDAAEDLRLAADHAAEALSSIDATELDARECHLACEATRLLSDKIVLAHAVTGGDPRAGAALQRFAEDVEAFLERYEATWRRRNRPERLGDISAVLTALVSEPRTALPR